MLCLGRRVSRHCLGGGFFGPCLDRLFAGLCFLALCLGGLCVALCLGWRVSRHCLGGGFLGPCLDRLFARLCFLALCLGGLCLGLCLHRPLPCSALIFRRVLQLSALLRWTAWRARLITLRAAALRRLGKALLQRYTPRGPRRRVLGWRRRGLRLGTLLWRRLRHLCKPRLQWRAPRALLRRDRHLGGFGPLLCQRRHLGKPLLQWHAR